MLLNFNGCAGSLCQRGRSLARQRKVVVVRRSKSQSEGQCSLVCPNALPSTCVPAEALPMHVTDSVPAVSHRCLILQKHAAAAAHRVTSGLLDPAEPMEDGNDCMSSTGKDHVGMPRPSPTPNSQGYDYGGGRGDERYGRMYSGSNTQVRTRALCRKAGGHSTR